MNSYVKEAKWKCEGCGSEQEFHYGRTAPRFCSNVCKFRARDEQKRAEREKELRGWRNR